MTHHNSVTMSGWIYSDLELKTATKSTYETAALDFQLKCTFRTPVVQRYVIEQHFQTCRATGSVARHIAKYCVKGDQIFVSGYLRSFPKNSTRPLTILRVVTVQFLDTIGRTGTLQEVIDQAAEIERRQVAMDADAYTALTPDEINDLLDADQLRLARAAESAAQLAKGTD